LIISLKVGIENVLLDNIRENVKMNLPGAIEDGRVIVEV
jgi:hypothetical protein